jgi:hypothetical protein
MPFDPKAYLQDQEPAAAGFDPNAYLADKQEAVPGEATAPTGPYQSPGESPENGWLDNTKARVSDPNRWKALAGIKSPAKLDVVEGDAPTLAMPAGNGVRAANWIGKALQGEQAAPAVRAPQALDKLSQFLNFSAPRRIATGVAQGVATNPSDPVTGGLTGGGMAIGGEALSKGVSLAKRGAVALGGKLSGVWPETARNYAKNPALAEELYGLNKSNPEALAERVREQARGAVGAAYDNESKPLLERLGQKVAPTELAVDPTQYKGTAAEPIIKQAWAKRGQTLKVPVSEPYQVQASPLNYEWKPTSHPQLVTPKVEASPLNMEYQSIGGKQLVSPEIQASPLKMDTTGYQRKSIPSKPEQVNPTIETDLLSRRPVPSQPATELPEISVQMHERRSVPSEPQTTLEGLLDRGAQHVPAPMPDRVQLTGAQGLQAKRAMHEAAQFKFNQNPEVYSAANDADAIGGSNLRKALESVAPESAAINDQLEEAARMSGAANRTMSQNPSRFLGDSEAPGSVPMRSVRQWLDKHGGSGLEGMAKALSAGTEMNAPVDGLLRNLIAKPTGKALLRNSSRLETPEIGAMLRQLALEAQKGQVK